MRDVRLFFAALFASASVGMAAAVLLYVEASGDTASAMLFGALLSWLLFSVSTLDLWRRVHRRLDKSAMHGRLIS